MRATAVHLDNKEEDLKGASTTITAHGDGTYHTNHGEYGGKRVEHASIGAALMHIAKRHSEGDHAHVHATDDGKLTTHHVSEEGRVQGPHDHKNLRDLKRSLTEFLDEEGAEG